MGAQEALGGFWVQVVIAVLNGLRTLGQWEFLTIEPHPKDVNDSEKVDLRWQLHGGVVEKHDQIKSSVNAVGLSALEKWAQELAQGSQAQQKTLVVVGAPAKNARGRNEIIGVTIRFEPPSEGHRTLMEAASFRLMGFGEVLGINDVSIAEEVVERLVATLFAGSVTSRTWSKAEFIAEIRSLAALMASQSQSTPALAVRRRRHVVMCISPMHDVVDLYSLLHLRNPTSDPIDLNGTKATWTISEAGHCEPLHVTDGLPDLTENDYKFKDEIRNAQRTYRISLRGHLAPGEQRTAGIHVKLSNTIASMSETFFIKEPFFETSFSLPTTVQWVMPHPSTFDVSDHAVRRSSRVLEWTFDTKNGRRDLNVSWKYCAQDGRLGPLDNRLALACVATAVVSLGCRPPDWLSSYLDPESTPDDIEWLWQKRLSGQVK